MIRKSLVQNTFDTSATTYDSVAEVQRASSKFLVDFLADFLGDCLEPSAENVHSILDIGCGTGNTSLELLKMYPEAEFCLCDISSKMLEVAAQKMPNKVSTICCDAEFHEFRKHYDLIISNLSLQWFEDIIGFLNRIKEYGRIFAFSTLLNGSFGRYKELFKFPPTFEYVEEDELVRAVPRIKKYVTKWYNIEFENFFAVARYFKKMGAYCSDSKQISEAEKKELYIRLLGMKEKINLDYEVFFGIIERE